MLSSFSSLDRHMLVHSGERPFSCQFCGQTFTTNGNMHRHQRTHGSKDGEEGGKVALPAKRPKKREASFSLMDREETSNNNLTERREIMCPLCEKMFGGDIALETHIMSVHPGQQLKCESCCAVYPTYQSLNIHMYLHHFQRLTNLTDNKYPLVPPLVPISLPAAAALSPMTKHLEGALTRPLTKDKDLADVQSILSITQNFSGMPANGNRSQDSLAESITSDHSNFSESDSSARKRIRLEEGESLMSDERGMSMTEDVERMDEGEPGRTDDGETFLDDDPVIKEMKMKGEFPCSQCPAVFPNLRALKGHNKEHLGKAPYRCNVGTCTYSSNDKSTLTRHMRRHTGEKPFECKVCNFGFTTKANCERHLKNKHRKTTRDQIRDCLLIHETEDTETLISRMQMTGDITINRDNPHDEPIDVENDFAFRCKVCKLTFMSKFAVIQHGIHTHPEYAKDVDHIAEAIGENRVGNFDLHHRYNSHDDDTPLDLSKDKDDDQSIDLTGDGDNDSINMESNLSAGPKLPGHFPPGFPMMLPGQQPPSMFYPYLAAMPYLLSQQSLISGLQSKNNFYGAQLPVPQVDITSLLAAQEFAKKQAEFMQQREAAEALQNLSQAPVQQKPEEKVCEEVVQPVKVAEAVSESEEKLDESMYKMVIKNGVLMKKPKQKRYRTERPYSCQSCNAKFTLRSNMERHIKQQHPNCWSGKGRGSRKHLFPLTLQAHESTENYKVEGEDTDTEKEDDGLLVIDDKPDKRKEEDPADLASVTKLLNTATTQSFPQFMSENNDQREGEDDLKENGDERKSAYSAAPHKIDCPFCFRKFPWTSSLNRHILTHTGQKPYKCQDCQLWFTTKSNRDRHQVRKHGGVLDFAHNSRNVSDRPFKCSKCPSSTFSSEENLIKHHYEKHLDMEYTAHTMDDQDDDESIGLVDVKSYFKCHICSEEFLHRAETIAHIEDEHPETYRENQDVYEAASRIPIDANFKRDPNDESMIRVNCIFCPCQFRSTVELGKHVLSHTRSKQYLCDICSTEFTSRIDFIKHKKTHEHNQSSDNNISSNDHNQNRRSDHVGAMTPERPNPMVGNIVTKRANLMDKINKLSLLNAAKAGKSEPFHRLFGHHVSASQQPT